MLEKLRKAQDERENSQFKPKDFTRQRNEMEFHHRNEQIRSTTKKTEAGIYIREMKPMQGVPHLRKIY